MIVLSLSALHILSLIFLPLYLRADPDWGAGYDVRQYYPECTSLQKPLNQGSCGSCWAFSTTGVSSDILCIQGYTTTYMSPEHSIQCDTQNNGCNGGYIVKAFDFHVNSGLVQQSCKMYLGTSARRCSTECDDGASITPAIVYKMQNVTHIYKRGNLDETANLIMKAIKETGPVAASYRVYKEFQDYYNDKDKARKIYHVDTTQGMTFLTYHAVKIVGWGVSGSDPYWIIQNSWGTNWADGGYFRLNASTAAGKQDGYEGELDILGDVYQPYIEPYIDPCADYYQCSECLTHKGSATARSNRKRVSSTKAETKNLESSILRKAYQRSGAIPAEENADTDENPRCGYCLTTDRCVSVNADGKPARGTCDEMASAPAEEEAETTGKRANQEEATPEGTTEETTEDTTNTNSNLSICPLDDCVAYTSDPVNCLNHRGCQFCVQTNKCRKGSKGQMNTGTCLDAITSRAQLIQNYSCFLKTSQKTCTDDASCTWCYEDTTGKGVDTGRCYPLFTGSSEPRPKLGRCVGCKCTVKGVSNPSTTEVTPEVDVCRSLPCDMCATSPNSPCVWCHTTETCISASKASECSIVSTHNSLTNKLGTVGKINFSSNKLTRCNRCLNYSSCADCANDPQCGWYKQASLCMPGLIGETDVAKSLLPEAYKHDTFIVNKLRCPAIIIDDADDSSSSSSYLSHSSLYFAIAAVGAAILRLAL